MGWLKEIHEQPWRITIAAVGGLLVAIIIAGLVGFLLNQNVKQVADEALRYDVELEDHGDDLRAAVLDVRHYHRNIAFGGPSRGGIEEFERAYARLQQEIDELEELGVRDPDAPQPDEIRAMANEYYDSFRPAIDLAETERVAFTEASDRGLRQIDEMESAAREIDKLGEELSADSLQEVDRAATTATFVLLAAIGGLVLAGVALAYAAVHVVNELRRLNAEQRVAAERLAEASRAKTNFIADVSHELRTPLTVLRGNAEVGLSLMDDGCAHEEILEEIVKESGRMSRMVEDLLFLAKSDSASLPLDLETVAVRPFLETLAGRAEVLARERGATLETKLEGKGILSIDPPRIEQAVLILVDNAAKYGPAGGRITLASATRLGELRIKVEDRGPGIPKEELPYIFERFYRIDKMRTRKYEGTGPGQGGVGLGLPIAKTIVEAHGGRIEAASRAGEWTRMSLYLPLLVEPKESRSTGRSAQGFEMEDSR